MASDPTCFIVDEEIVPFDLRDGWSARALARPIAMWTKAMFDLDIKVTLKE
jgi:hypothetical protein